MDDKLSKSGVYFTEYSKSVYVVFGGGIKVALASDTKNNRCCIGFQQLSKTLKCGEKHNEDWVDSYPTIHLVINNKKTIEILRDALDWVENELTKNEE